MEAYPDRPLNPERVAAVEVYGVGSILDVGCGSGAYVRRSETDSFGVDLVPADLWRESKTSRFGVADAASLPFRDESVSTVLCFETLEHVPDPEAVAAELFRVCAERLIVSVPNCLMPSAMLRSNLVFGHWRDRTHVNFFDSDSLVALLADAGFDVMDVYLINRIDLGPVVADSLRLPRRLEPLVSKIMRVVAREYPMTILGVFEK